jgi:hypothetical protein
VLVAMADRWIESPQSSGQFAITAPGHNDPPIALLGAGAALHQQLHGIDADFSRLTRNMPLIPLDGAAAA